MICNAGSGEGSDTVWALTLTKIADLTFTLRRWDKVLASARDGWGLLKRADARGFAITAVAAEQS